MTTQPQPTNLLILARATAAAKAACHGLPDRGACGFAWVKISGNEPFARWCRKMAKAAEAEGRRHHPFGSKPYDGGWQWWNPGQFPGQSIDAIEAGAKAFALVLGEHGIRASWSSRLD